MSQINNDTNDVVNTLNQTTANSAHIVDYSSSVNTNDSSFSMIFNVNNKNYLDKIGLSEIFKDAIIKSTNISDSTLRKNVLEFLTKFYNILQNFSNVHNSDLFLPKLSLTQEDDESVMIEWIYESFRIGFSFENDESANWFLVTNDKHDEFWTSGKITEEFYINELIEIIKFATLNS